MTASMQVTGLSPGTERTSAEASHDREKMSNG
jgi:hypothetical protein